MPSEAQPHTPDMESLMAAELLRERDVAVFEIFFKYVAYCISILLQQFYNVPREDIENFVGDGLLRAFRRGAKYDPERAPIRIWLLWNARIEAIKFLREHKPHVLGPLDLATDIATRVADSNPAVSNNARHHLKTMLASLPKRQRAVLLMQLEEYPDSEIAKVLGITETTVRGHRRRALDRLKGSQDE